MARLRLLQVPRGHRISAPGREKPCTALRMPSSQGLSWRRHPCPGMGSSEPHPPLPPARCQSTGLAAEGAGEPWELASIADSLAPCPWRLPGSPRVQAFWPQTHQLVRTRPLLPENTLPHPCADRGRFLLGFQHLRDSNIPGNTQSCP